MQVNFDNRNFNLGLAEAGQDLVDMSGEVSEPRSQERGSDPAVERAYQIAEAQTS